MSWWWSFSYTANVYIEHLAVLYSWWERKPWRDVSTSNMGAKMAVREWQYSYQNKSRCANNNNLSEKFFIKSAKINYSIVANRCFNSNLNRRKGSCTMKNLNANCQYFYNVVSFIRHSALTLTSKVCFLYFTCNVYFRGRQTAAHVLNVVRWLNWITVIMIS